MVSEVWKSVGFKPLPSVVAQPKLPLWHFSANIKPRWAKMGWEESFGDILDVCCRKKGRQDWKNEDKVSSEEKELQEQD